MIDVPDPLRYKDRKLFTACYVDSIIHFFHVACWTETAESRVPVTTGWDSFKHTAFHHVPITHRYINKPKTHTHTHTHTHTQKRNDRSVWDQYRRSLRENSLRGRVWASGTRLIDWIAVSARRSMSAWTFSSYISERLVPGHISTVTRSWRSHRHNATQGSRCLIPDYDLFNVYILIQSHRKLM